MPADNGQESASLRTDSVDGCWFDVFIPRLDALKLRVLGRLDESGVISRFSVVDASVPADHGTEIALDDLKDAEISDLVDSAVKKFLARYTTVARTFDDSWRRVVANMQLAINDFCLDQVRSLGCLLPEGQQKTASGVVDESEGVVEIAVDKVNANSCRLKILRFPISGADFMDVMIEVFDFSSPSSFSLKPEVLRVDRLPVGKLLDVKRLRQSRWHRLRVRAGEHGPWSDSVEITTPKLT